ncbi:MAG: hypothetical protein QM497_09575 [Sulfurimonas sp.]
MKIILIWSLTVLLSMADYSYEKGKIDTHGGQYDDAYTKKKAGFKSDIACMSDFLNRDKNSSKKSSK